VPHELLKGRKAHVLIRFVRTKGVSEGMDTHLFANPGLFDVFGVPGVSAGFFTVVGLAKIISVWPGLRSFRKCCKINDRLWLNFRGFLLTLITTAETGL
jgi:hypothetical protein